MFFKPSLHATCSSSSHRFATSDLEETARLWTSTSAGEKERRRPGAMISYQSIS
jgi:hypothetical protein